MKQAPQQQPASAAPAMLDHLLQPLQEHMLPELSVRDLAALRGTNQLFKSLLDSASGQSWHPAMRYVLPPEIIQYAAVGAAMQAMLQAQASILQNLRSADAPCQMHCFPTNCHTSAKKILWSPRWPSQYIAVLMSVEQEARKEWRNGSLPSDLQPTLLVDCSTWTAMPGFKPEWNGSHDTPDKWQGAWCSGHCPSKPASACFTSGQALEVASVVHGELQCERLPGCSRAHHLSPQGTLLLCSAPDDAALVWLIDVPSLTVRSCSPLRC